MLGRGLIKLARQPHNILKEMNSIKNKLHRAIGLSQSAYDLYRLEKKYYQALRIKHANEKVYELLELFLYKCDEKEVKVVHTYIFHLEDWFNQFADLELRVTDLASEFIFARFETSPAFPKEILEITQS